MDPRFSQLIHDYQAAVGEAVELLVRSGIPLPDSNTAWTVTDVRQIGELAGGVRYFKHGYGCTVKLPTGTIDFDFGEHGDIDGFDVWRLRNFARCRLSSYGFASEEEVGTAFEAAWNSGELVFSGYILYYLKCSSTG